MQICSVCATLKAQQVLRKIFAPLSPLDSAANVVMSSYASLVGNCAWYSS